MKAYPRMMLRTVSSRMVKKITSAAIALLFAAVAPSASASEEMRTLVVSPGDTLLGMLQNEGVPASEALPAINTLGKVFNVAALQPKQEIFVSLDPADPAGSTALRALQVDLSFNKRAVVRKTAEGFAGAEETLETETRTVRADFEIRSSLYRDGVRVGVPGTVLKQISKLLSYNMDLQRQIKKGDLYTVLYEAEVSTENRTAGGELLAVKYVQVNGDETEIYRFTDNKGNEGFYFGDGQGVERSLLQTPVDAARISSKFGMRRHPILGYNKMHKGVDFAAGSGTPVYAAGNGVISKAGRHGGYGNYVRIRHRDGISSAYAHLKGFASGIKNGVNVKQGQVIGYVGSTGRSTGPHLHYEVLKNGKQINPLAMKTMPVTKLQGVHLAIFTHYKAAVNALHRDAYTLSATYLASRR